jgi:hypothetical protein
MNMSALVTGTMFALAGPLGSAAVQAFQYAKDRTEAAQLIPTHLRRAKAAMYVSLPVTRYVTRPSLEEQLRQFLTKPFSDAKIYAILAGPKGIGKSTLAAYVCKDLTATVAVGINDLDTRTAILQKLLRACGLSFDGVDENLILDALCRDVSNNLIDPPKIVMEVERGGDRNSSDILRVVSSLAKKFAEFANVLVVVSEANATLEFTSDPQRQEIFWIPDLTRDEAMSLWNKKNPMLTYYDAAFDAIEQKIGFQPAALAALFQRMQNPGFNLDNYLNEQVAVAKSELLKFKLYPILHALRPILLVLMLRISPVKSSKVSISPTLWKYSKR